MNVRRTVALALATLCAGLIAAGAIPAQTQNPGAADMVLEGGTSGKVPFPHRRHQQANPDCTVCHARFPQKAGAIEELKEQGSLPRKQVMNELCTRCHKERQAAGQSSGPVTCTKCHVKG